MTHIVIKLNLNENNLPIFSADSLLKGFVKVSVNNPTSVKLLHVVVNGYAHTHFTDTFKANSYRGREKFINSSKSLLAQHGIQPGTHKYEFTFQLPKTLPASYSDDYCEIKYVISANIDLHRGTNKSVEKNFIVIRRDEPYLTPELLVPASFEEIKTFCSLLCKAEPFIMKASIPFSIYTVGQNIPIRVKYFNQSGVRITSTLFRLVKKIEYKASTPEVSTKLHEEIVARKTEMGVRAKCQIEFEAFFDIPANLPPSNEKFCNIINITYKLAVEAYAEGYHINIEHDFPITLLGATNRANAYISYSSALSVVRLQTPTICDGNNDDRPPSYYDCVEMTKLNSDHKSSKQVNIGWNDTLT